MNVFLTKVRRKIAVEFKINWIEMNRTNKQALQHAFNFFRWKIKFKTN